jgi:hypothetical protein
MAMKSAGSAQTSRRQNHLPPFSAIAVIALAVIIYRTSNAKHAQLDTIALVDMTRLLRTPKLSSRTSII